MEYYTIGEVAKMCSIPVKTLRYYDEIDLLKPDKISQTSHYRYYSKESTLRIPLIKYYKQLGFKLEDIKRLIYELSIEELKDFFSKELQTVEAQIAELRKKHFAITEWRQLLKHGESLLAEPREAMQIDIRTIPLYKTVHFNYQVPANQEHEQLFYSNSFVEICNHHQILAYGPFMLYFGDIGQRVSNTFTEVDCYTSVIENRSALATQEIGDFAAVTSIHKGNYATIGDTYQSMMDWASRSSLKLQGASYERYIIDPWSTNQAENYITELILPIRGV